MKKILLLLISFFITNVIVTPKIFKVDYSNKSKFELTIKSNIRLYINNVYKGLFVKELKGILTPSLATDSSTKITGEVYHYQKTIRSKSTIGIKVDNFEPCEFYLYNNGMVKSIKANSFPILQGVPFFPTNDIEAGDIYKGDAFITIANYNKKGYSILPIHPTVKYFGKKEIFGINADYFEISFFYGSDANNDEIQKANGMHKIRLYYNTSTSTPIYLEDKFEETFIILSGETLTRKGFSLYFYKNIKPMQKDHIIEDLDKYKEKYIINNLNVQKKDQGISLTLNNLHFLPDSTQLISEDSQKVIQLVEFLKGITNRSFLIIGHTALSGTEEERMKLSFERAKSIASYLANNGIDPSRLFYTGKGAKEPIATNNTPEGMKKNRRVEIIILED